MTQYKLTFKNGKTEQVSGDGKHNASINRTYYNSNVVKAERVEVTTHMDLFN